MISTYETMFGTKPRTIYSSPLERGDHPELDTTPELNEDGIRKYQSLIGAMQWAISLGRIDITTTVMTLSKFRVQPREGHLERCKRIYGYLAKMKQAAIRVRVDEPNYTNLPEPNVEWAQTVYGDVQELVPEDAPEPLGRPVTMTTYVQIFTTTW